MGPMSARNLHGLVVQELGQRIVGGALQPGEILPREATLAEQMDVSRTSLREAMKVLSAKGLVEARPKIGTRVRDQRFWNQLDPDVLAWRCQSMPTDDFVQKLVEMRDIIEPAAAAAAARRRDEAHLQQLGEALQAMADADDRDAWTVADVDFHEAMLSATGNELLTSLFAVIETAMSSYFALSARSAEDFKYSLPHHEKVFEAIRKQQPEVARRAMQRIIADSRANMDKGHAG
ncbi:FadR family transcriptional regulator [Oleiagrimonas sp. C23AA]|nr:FadR family transcriptional regulator [Oleiagrimonas sp. C23AA]